MKKASQHRIVKKASQHRINEWKARFLRALHLRHEGDLLQAQIADEVWTAAGEDKARAYGILDLIGVPPSRKNKLWRMALVYRVVDRDLWVAVGWSGVRDLVDMPPKKRRAKTREIRKAAKGGRLPREVKARILPRPPKPRAAEGGAPGPRGPRSPGARSPGGARGKVEGSTEPLLEVVLRDLAKLAAFNPGTLALLSPRVREAVEARMRAEAS